MLSRCYRDGLYHTAFVIMSPTTAGDPDLSPIGKGAEQAKENAGSQDRLDTNRRGGDIAISGALLPGRPGTATRQGDIPPSDFGGLA